VSRLAAVVAARDVPGEACPFTDAAAVERRDRFDDVGLDCVLELTPGEDPAAVEAIRGRAVVDAVGVDEEVEVEGVFDAGVCCDGPLLARACGRPTAAGCGSSAALLFAMLSRSDGEGKRRAGGRTPG
jgi:hypothetical protein